MMVLQLRDNLHWCDSGGRAVFLDLEADLYFCLSQMANDAFLRLAAGSSQPEDAERLHLLIGRGMLIEANTGRPIPQPPLIDPPTRDYIVADLPQGAGFVQISRALASELRAARLLRTKSFQRVIEDARNRGRGTRPIALDADRSIKEIVSAAGVLSFITRSHDRCLVRALAVHSMCRKNGVRSKLVFGVIAHPFTAHCWVQLGNAVLVGGYEQARLFTPILVVE